MADLALERLSGSVFGYYNLWSYLDSHFKRLIGRRRSHKPKSCLDFYRKVFDGEIKHGDRVVLQSFLITEWIPRAPGGIAHLFRNGKLTKSQYDNFPIPYRMASSYLHPGNVAPPFGSSRLPLQKDKNVALGAVSFDEFHTDLGIVLSVSQSVYSEFLSKQLRQDAVEGTVEGFVEMYDTPVNFPEITQALLIADVVRTWSTPKFVIRVDSPIQIKFRLHNSHPVMNVWSIRRVGHKQFGVGYDFVYLPVQNDIDDLSLAQRIINNSSHFINVESWANEFADSPREFLEDFDEPNQQKLKYVTEFTPLTEFDGRNSALEALIPLRSDPRHQPVAAEKYLNELLGLEKQKGMSPYKRHVIVTTPPDYDEIRFNCPKANADFVIQVNLGKRRRLRKGNVPFPANNRFKCPLCGDEGYESQMLKLRREIESKWKTKIVT